MESGNSGIYDQVNNRVDCLTKMFVLITLNNKDFCTEL